MKLERSCFLETENVSSRAVGQIWRGECNRVVLPYISVTQASWVLRKTKPDRSLQAPRGKMWVYLLSCLRQDRTFRGTPDGWQDQTEPWVFLWASLPSHWGIFLQRWGYQYYSFSTGVATIALSGHKSLINMFLWFGCYLLFNNCPIILINGVFGRHPWMPLPLVSVKRILPDP